MKKILLLFPLLTILFFSCNLDSSQGLLQEAVTAPEAIIEVVNGIYGRTDDSLIVGTQHGIYTINSSGSFERLGLNGNKAQRTIYADLTGAVYFDDVDNAMVYERYDGTGNPTTYSFPDTIQLIDKYSSNGREFTFIIREETGWVEAKIGSENYLIPIYNFYAYYLPQVSSAQSFASAFSNFSSSRATSVSGYLFTVNSGNDSPTYETSSALKIIGDNLFIKVMTPRPQTDKSSITGNATYLYSTSPGIEPSGSLPSDVRYNNHPLNTYNIVGLGSGYEILANGRVYQGWNYVQNSNNNTTFNALRIPVYQNGSELIYLYPNTSSYYIVNSSGFQQNQINAIRTTYPYSIVGRNSQGQYLVLTVTNGLFVLTPTSPNEAGTYKPLTDRTVSISISDFN